MVTYGAMKDSSSAKAAMHPYQPEAPLESGYTTPLAEAPTAADGALPLATAPPPPPSLSQWGVPQEGQTAKPEWGLKPPVSVGYPPPKNLGSAVIRYRLEFQDEL